MSDNAETLIGEVIQNLEPGAFVTKWILVAEVIDTNGERAIWTDLNDDATKWDALGLLHYAIDEQTRNGEPDDDE